MFKKTLAILLALLLALSALASLAEAVKPAKSDFAAALEARYVDPDRIYSSDVRWWLGDASNTDEALRRFWEQHYLSDPELCEKIKQGDVQLFMDSLELTYGDGFTWWCEDAVEQFEAIKGYDPMPYVVMVSGVGSGFEFALNTYYDMNGVNDFIFGMPNMTTFMLEQSDEYDYLVLREQLVNDWQDVMTQLYEERMLKPVKGLTATIYDADGNEIEYENTGRVEYTGGINWDNPKVDIGDYLVDGTNTIRIVYNSSITNAALAAGVIQEKKVEEGAAWYGSPALWWGSAGIGYRSNGPQQAKLVPYADIPIAE